MGGLRKLSREELLLRFGRYGLPPFDWIEEGRLMASVYPNGLEYLKYLRTKEGIGFCINLAEAPWPDGWSQGAKVACLHVPVVDMGLPTIEQACHVIDAIDSSPSSVMLHCAAGLGRTGTMISLYLTEKGLSGPNALEVVRSRRPGSVQTTEQERMVLEWTKGRGCR
jgi:atypical dual specificity phosphatase